MNLNFHVQLVYSSNLGKYDDYTPLYITTLDQFTTEVQDFPYICEKPIPVVCGCHFLYLSLFRTNFYTQLNQIRDFLYDSG